MTGHCQNDGGGIYLWWPNALILIMHSNFVLSISTLEHKRPIKLALRMALMSLLNNGWWCSSCHHSISLPPFPPSLFSLFLCHLYPTTFMSLSSLSFLSLHYIPAFCVWVGIRKIREDGPHNKQQMLAICGVVRKNNLNLALILQVRPDSSSPVLEKRK